MLLRGVAASIAIGCAASGFARADDLADIRRQIQELRSSYEARIEALEKRVKEAEARAAAAAHAHAAAPVETSPSTASTATAATSPSTARTATANAFNPAISLTLQGRYANLSQDPASFAIAGFAPQGETGPGRRGFSLQESELTLAANVDHKFGGVLTFALSPENEVSVEEAYGTMIAPFHGIAPKFGRFLSGVGYLNEQHSHTWDFADAPLAYQAFFGGQYRNDGIQLKWLAPTDQFIEVGAEGGSGSGFPGSERDKNGIASGALYVHTGGDVGVSHSWRAGLSYLRTRDDESRRTHLAIADFVWKWAPQGNARERNLKLQGELFQQSQAGWKPAGGYLQAVYQFMPQWRVGARYDRLDPDGGADFARGSGEDPVTFRPRRSSVMVDYSPSEFSRLRLQVARSRTLADLTDNQVFLQYILSLGAHAAHRY